MKNDPVGEIVATNVRRLRQGRRWTLRETAEELASELGDKQLSEAGMSRWEDASSPRRFSMTELYAVCRVFGVPLARLFLPDRDSSIPTINGAPFYAVWEACFVGTESTATDWQRVEFVQRPQSDNSGGTAVDLGVFSEEEVARAVELLRQARSESERTSGDVGDE